MQDKNQLDCYDDMKKDKSDFYQEQCLPTRYDWRLSNCDEKRTIPCKLKDNIKHTIH